MTSAAASSKDGLKSVWRELDQAAGFDVLVRDGLGIASSKVPVAGRVVAHELYREDPVAWAAEKLGVPEHTLRWSLNPGYDSHEWDGTADPLVAAADALARGEDVGIQSGTTTGKSFLLAVLILWFLACWQGARVFSFAPKKDQLTLFSWAEIAKLWPRFQRHFPTAELTTLRIRMMGDDSWGAWGYPVGVGAEEESATKARGMHAEHMLLIYEEATGIPQAVMTAGEQTSAAPHNLRIAVGNPDHVADPLGLFCAEPDVTAVRASALDHPNIVAQDPSIVPGAVSEKSVDRRRRKHGEDGRLFLSMVRGLAPQQAADALIRWEWLERAYELWQDTETREALRLRGKPALGLDLANSEDGDEGARAYGEGAVLVEVISRPCPDANVFGAEAVTFAKASGIEARYCGFDNVGVGAGAVNEAKRLGFRVRALNAGESAMPRLDHELLEEEGVAVVEEELYANLRAQMWWTFRTDLQHGRLALDKDEALWRELVTPLYTTRSGRILVQPKEEIVKLLKRSPNKADAVIHWNFVRYRLPEKEPAPDVRPFDPEVLAAEADAVYRHTTPPPPTANPMTAWLP